MYRVWAATIANVAQDAGRFPSSRALDNRDRLLRRETIVNPGTHTANGTASSLAVYSANENQVTVSVVVDSIFLFFFFSIFFFVAFSPVIILLIFLIELSGGKLIFNFIESWKGKCVFK